ncbi:hypothetical protein CK203_073524 [Vitis vinifera]|uniref:Uncharacterized protein n=1 Tax=Vitis vinifera TaxID=29760 RepID=A0A438EJY8_VITVI|nr:hypothetical protein CK203_073524 [Vitis vinifera]
MVDELQAVKGADVSSPLCCLMYMEVVKQKNLGGFQALDSCQLWCNLYTPSVLGQHSLLASVYSLLQAATEISSRGDGRDRDINVFVQRRDQLSAKQPEINEWFWSEQVQLAVRSFVNYFERDPRFTAATSVSIKGMSLGSGNASDISLLMLALTCIEAIMNLGQAKISCSQFFSMIPDITGRLMDMLVDFIPIHQAYHSIKDIGLQREFLVHFGPRAAACRVKNARGTEEVVFWVDLIQKQLQRAIDRERIWSKLTTSESIEVSAKGLRSVFSHNLLACHPSKRWFG